MNSDDIRSLIDQALKSENGVVPEEKAKKILGACGVPVVREISVERAEDSGAAAASLGFPVVLKGAGPDILHKTELGLVQKGLANEKDVLEAALEMAKSSAGIESFLIQPQLQGSREFVAGVFRDPLFGPVVLFGLGGTMAEVLNDTVIKIAPLSEYDMEEMFEGMDSQPLLDEFRGEPPVDKEALKKILRALSELAAGYPEIREIDVNPIMIDPEGAPVAVDGLIIVKEPEKENVRRGEVDREAFRACFYPKSVAFVGASGTLTKWGHSLPANLLSRDFRGMSTWSIRGAES